MTRQVAFLFLAACLCGLAPAGAAKPPPAKAEPAPPPKREQVVRPWMLPPYLLLGLPRDLLDAPSKGLSSIPLFNKVFVAPLMILNALTTSLCWSLTEEGTDGGYAAWIDCLGLKRVPKAAAHKKVPWHLRYGPNWRSFGIIYWKTVPPPPPPAPTPSPPSRP